MTIQEKLDYCSNRLFCFGCKIKKEEYWIGCRLFEETSEHINILENAVKQIVRCKDCVFSEEVKIGYQTKVYCRHRDGLSNYKESDPLGFCSLAKPKDA